MVISEHYYSVMCLLQMLVLMVAYEHEATLGLELRLIYEHDELREFDDLDTEDEEDEGRLDDIHTLVELEAIDERQGEHDEHDDLMLFEVHDEHLLEDDEFE